MRRLALVALFAFFAVACGAVPVQAKSLTLAYHAGDTYRYTFHSITRQTMDAGGMTIPTEIETSAKETVKVKSVDPSGTADLAITLTNSVLKSTSGTITTTTTGLLDTTIDVSVAADGRILSMDGTQYAGSNPFLAFSGIGEGFFVTAVLPTNAVKPGDTWSKDYSQAVPDGSGSIQITSHSKYLRDESINGINAAVVETTSNGSIDVSLGVPQPASGQPSVSPLGGGTFTGLTMKGTVTADVTTWIDPSDHRILRTHATETNDGTMTFDMSGQNPLPMLSGPITTKGSSTTDLDPA
jgi:hypothetical protein